MIRRHIVFRLRGLLLCCLLWLGHAHAQTWNAAALLQEANAHTIVLQTASGQTVAEVQRLQLQRSSDVLQRLAKAYGMETPQLYVIASQAANAVASTRDGVPEISITVGMLRLAGERDEHLAAVIGHELAHVQAGHASLRRHRSEFVSTMGALLGAAIDISAAWHGYTLGGAGIELTGLGANLINAKFSRDQEREADQMGTQAMARAGYDPAGAVGFWRLVAGTVAGGDGTWLSTHPSNAEREAELEARVQALEPVYAANRGKRESTAPAAADAPAAPGGQAQTRWLAPATADVTALGLLALQHFTGEANMAKDHARARAYGERAARAGDPVGKAVYGTVLRDGIAGAADPTLGIQLLQEAADHNVGWAHYQLGVAYQRGLGVPADRKRAVQHLSVAAVTVIEAQELLSRIRAEGK